MAGWKLNLGFGSSAKWATRNAKRLDDGDDKDLDKALAWLPKLAREALHAGPSYGGDGPVSPGKARMGAAIVLGVFTLIWNGFIAVFITMMVSQGAPLGMKLFMIPFVLVGLGLVFGVLFMILGLANPKLHLTFRPRVAAAGQRVRLEWTIEGRAERMLKLTIRVEAEERAIYRRGTNTYTDKHVLWSRVVYEHGDAAATSAGPPRLGEAEFTLPADAMHSLDAPNNKIVWRVMVVGDIPRWPNVKDEYAFAVVPAHMKSRL